MQNSHSARCGLAMLSGAAYAAAYPPLGWRWMVFVGLAGLLIALRGQKGTHARAIGFLHGMTAYALSLSWLFHIFGWLVILLWAILAAFTALFAEMQGRALVRGISGYKLVVFTTVNWCGWEFIRAELFPLKFPWMTPGLAMGPNFLLPWIGVYGVGALVMLGVAMLLSRKWVQAGCVACILATAIFLPTRISPPAENDSRSIAVAGLQYESVSLDQFVQRTREISPAIRHVVWPEYAAPFDIQSSRRDWDILLKLCRDRNITLTLGTQSRPGGGEAWRNIALTLDATGVRGEHTKVHTVHLFNDGTPGTTALPVETNHGKIGTPICFDCDYENVIRKMTSAGAECFLVPMMDAESWTARQHDQHAELFRIRARENGRWMLVCATSGISQLIDPNGFVHTRLAAMAQGPITGVLFRENRLTFYTAYGWLIPWCLLGGAIVSWLRIVVFKSPLRENKNPRESRD